ncbi:radical SAM/SPASM domain-containing protein, partial [Helicobacter sp. UBA3407]|uniref:radical SAM/SPASM domain-containing protein n=1 Tax=Helicobacter sp. UBA3407 TaxID=1946588 RepID=UPI00260CD2CE
LFFFFLFIFFFFFFVGGGGGGGGGVFDSLLAFNMDLQDCSKETIKQICLANQNCYALFFNPYEARRDSLLFKLCEANLEKYIIEYTYKNHWIEKETRNLLHSFGQKIFKTDFFADRRLYNLSESWELINPKLNKQESLQLHFPKVIYIGLLNVCNVNCPHCPWFSLTHQQTHTNNYFKIKRQLASSKVNEILEYASKGGSKVIFSGPGEPLLDFRLLGFVQKARNLGIKRIELATNGILLSENFFKDLLEAGVSFFDISILFAKEVYNQCCKGFLVDYQKTLRQLANICGDLAYKAKIKLSICYDKEFLREALEFFLQIKEYEFIECQMAYYDTNAKYWEGGKLNNTRHTCSAPFSSLYVFPDGSVGFCESQRGWLGRKQVESFCIGNIYYENLEQIWQGKLHQKMQQKHLNLSFDKICEICGSWWNENF